MTFTDFIEEKTVEKLHDVFGGAIQTIYSWKRRNRIPEDYWPTLIETYSEVSWKMLHDMKTASKATS